MTDSASTDIFDHVERSRSYELSFSKLAKGIDNFHIDVRLSKQYCSELRKLVGTLLPQNTIQKQKKWDNSKAFDKLKDCYVDMMTVLIHRVKTDLDAERVCLLQLAAVKQIVSTVRSQLDSELAKSSTRLAELRHKGSSEALAVDQRLFWLKKNYQSILYTVNKQIFSQLKRVEDRKLKLIRQQFLTDLALFSTDIIFNPLLYTTAPSALLALVNDYSMWNWSGNDSGFININTGIEKLFAEKLSKLPFTPLAGEGEAIRNTEIHDELGGIFATQPYLGPAADQQDTLRIDLQWLDIPENMELLFNIERAEDKLEQSARELGFTLRRAKKAEIADLKKILRATSTVYSSNNTLEQLLASRSCAKALTPVVKEKVDVKLLCQFLSGHLSSQKLQDLLPATQTLSTEQLKPLELIQESIRAKAGNVQYVDLCQILQDLSQYRQDLKFLRFTHRAFNRISILTSEDELLLSREAGTLYYLPTADEVEDVQERICHHAILKADVRGSTTVTEELQNAGLNPASYFSMRFFNPINKILPTYGGNKVFIEGDAIILSFLEYEQTPQQWFAVARSCGLAKDMIRIVSANNRYSNQMNLPKLELGVGICYSKDAPRFLYDEDKPIMISSAIGLADRMSSCSWNLRQAIKKGLFNVDVLRIADGEHEKGEKGQQYVRYNVNGILIDNEAIEKLHKEIQLVPLSLRLNNRNCHFLVGQYPDMNGQKKDLVIRKGRVGIWRELRIEEDAESDENYYEVVVNRKVITLVMEANASRPKPGTKA